VYKRQETSHAESVEEFETKPTEMNETNSEPVETVVPEPTLEIEQQKVSDTVETEPNESKSDATIEVVEAKNSELVTSIDPVREVTAEPNIPVPTPAPQRPRIENQRAKPETVKQPSRQSKKTSKARTKAARPNAGSGGNSAANAKRASDASQSANVNRNQGNAAVSNYPGRVYAKISRTRRKSAGGSGTARVSFKINTGGGLSSVRLARSSGNARVDAAAIAHIKRAAPFPKPPAGAKRSFVIPVEFRR